MPYIPTTDAERPAMLKRIGVASIEDLFADIPDNVRFRGRLNVPPGMAEEETLTHLKGLAASNVNIEDKVCFLGAGAYDHLLPAAENRGNVVISATVNPNYIEVAQTYLQYQGVEVRVVPAKNGYVDMDALAAVTDEDTAAICAQQPNAYGRRRR